MVVSIIFARSSSPISWIIRRLTKSEFSHVAISLVDDHSVVIDADSFRPVKIKKNNFDYYKVAHVNMSPSDKNKFMDYVFKQVGTKYDYLQTIGLALRLMGLTKKNNLWDSPDRLECIELVDRAFLAIGIDIMPTIRDGDATPSDLAKILL